MASPRLLRLLLLQSEPALCVTTDAAADMIYHSVLVCVLNVIELLRVRGIDQTPTHPLARPALSLSTSPPVSYSTLRIVFASISPSLCFICASVLIVPLPPSLSVLYSSLY